MKAPDCTECGQPLPGFWVQIHGLEFLRVEEVWPDGDAPETPTYRDVAERIKASGGIVQWLTEWNMVDAVQVDVEGLIAFPRKRAA